LKSIGVDVSSLNNPQRQLLRLPINLAVFLEIDNPGFSFLSLSNLHDKLLEKKQRSISRKRKTSWSLIHVLTSMCDWMSQRQKLNAPISILDSYPNAVDILTSEGMIILSRNQVNFFHESFFDHVYARSFVNKNQSLVDLLSSTEQHLFRRTQVRQILEATRQSDFSRYRTELLSVLSKSEIRFHIKTAISQWLGSIDKPSIQEFEIISQFNEPSGKFNHLFRSAVLSTYKWFDFLNEKGWIQQQINGEDNDRSESVLGWLFSIADHRPVEVSSLLRSWWGNDADRAIRLLNWFGYGGHGNHAVDLQLCEDVINSHPRNLFHDEKSDHIRMLLHMLEQKLHERCGQIIHSLFDAWFALYPGRNIFERDELKLMDTHSLFEISEKTPLVFLQGTTDAIAHSIDLVIAEGEGPNWYNFNHRTYSGHRFGFDQFLGIYRSALKKIVQEAPESAVIYLDKLDPHKHQCFMH